VTVMPITQISSAVSFWSSRRWENSRAGLRVMWNNRHRLSAGRKSGLPNQHQFVVHRRQAALRSAHSRRRAVPTSIMTPESSAPGRRSARCHDALLRVLHRTINLHPNRAQYSRRRLVKPSTERHRHRRRPRFGSECCPPGPRWRLCFPGAWRQCPCGPSPVRRTAGALPTAHQFCLRRR